MIFRLLPVIQVLYLIELHELEYEFIMSQSLFHNRNKCRHLSVRKRAPLFIIVSVAYAGTLHKEILLPLMPHFQFSFTFSYI